MYSNNALSLLLQKSIASYWLFCPFNYINTLVSYSEDNCNTLNHYNNKGLFSSILAIEKNRIE